MNLLTRSDETLEWLKREIAKINQATKDAKSENDYADWQKVRAPRTQKEWKDYGERYEESGW